MPDLYPKDKAEGKTYRLRVDKKAANTRLDKFLDQGIEALSRSRIKALIDQGHCAKVANPSSPMTSASIKVKEGWEVMLHEPPPAPATPEPEDIPLQVIFEDSHLLVIDKPAGMVVHPAAGNQSGTLVNALLHHCAGQLSGIGGVARPGIVHRIDKDTSGLLVVAKTDEAHKGLSALFEAHDIHRRYLAFVKGQPQPPKGTVTGNIARHPANRKKMAVSEDRGKHAVTHYETLEAYRLDERIFASQVACTLETGRTHQVRVHMAHIGHPLLGDPVYARKLSIPKGQQALSKYMETFSRQALHAAELGFRHPVTEEKLSFKSALPPDLEKLKNLLLTS